MFDMEEVDVYFKAKKEAELVKLRNMDLFMFIELFIVKFVE